MKHFIEAELFNRQKSREGENFLHLTLTPITSCFVCVRAKPL